MISSSSHTSAARQRIKGYMRALEKYKLPHESALVHMGGLSSDSGYVIMNQLLSLPEKTAFRRICGQQLSTVGNPARD